MKPGKDKLSSKEENTCDEENKKVKKLKEDEDKPTELNYTSVIQSIEIFLKCLKTFNAQDTSNLREREKTQILELVYSNFIEPINKPVLNSTIIIFGQPGLGKTLLIDEILKNLSQQKFEYLQSFLKKPIKPISSFGFHCLYLNAMNFNNCFDFIDEFLHQVDSKTKFFEKKEKSKSNSIIKIEIFLNKLPKILENNKFVVFIDELENLSQNDKNNFHHLMQILNLKKPGFVNICISNTLNLFSNLNGNSLYLNFEYLIFKPYTEENLISIVKTRLTREKTEIHFEELLSSQGLSFIVKKAFKNHSSDVRFILSITQNIIENKQVEIMMMQKKKVVLNNKHVQITFPQILEVFNQKLCGDIGDIIAKLNYSTQILLLVIWQNIDAISQSVSLVQ